MGIENNMEKPKENEFEIEKIENPFDKKPIKKDPRVGFNSDVLLDLGDFKVEEKVEETLMQKLEKAAKEASPVIKDMVEKKIELNEEAINEKVGFVAQSNKNYEDMVKKEINEREGEGKI